MQLPATLPVQEYFKIRNFIDVPIPCNSSLIQNINAGEQISSAPLLAPSLSSCCLLWLAILSILLLSRDGHIPRTLRGRCVVGIFPNSLTCILFQLSIHPKGCVWATARKWETMGFILILSAATPTWLETLKFRFTTLTPNKQSWANSVFPQTLD